MTIELTAPQTETLRHLLNQHVGVKTMMYKIDDKLVIQFYHPHEDRYFIDIHGQLVD